MELFLLPVALIALGIVLCLAGRRRPGDRGYRSQPIRSRALRDGSIIPGTTLPSHRVPTNADIQGIEERGRAVFKDNWS